MRRRRRLITHCQLGQLIVQSKAAEAASFATGNVIEFGEKVGAFYYLEFLHLNVGRRPE